MAQEKIVIGWHGLPAYAARLIRGIDDTFPVIATRPTVPIAGMDDILPGRIHWITEDYADGWAGLNLAVPEIYFQPSWCTPSFNRLGDEVRREGGKVVVMFDNPWRGNLRQFMGAIRFRIQWRNHFVAAWVAGDSGARLARFWGFADANIYRGMYGADPTVFSQRAAGSLGIREKRFIFVARLVEQKGVRDLISAWNFFSGSRSDWTLHVYGTGPLEPLIHGPSITYHGFQQPEVISSALHQSRFLILPSHDEHWGLVVCEAAQAGCGLILSDAVGSHVDLLSPRNGRCFPAGEVSRLVETLEWASRQNTAQLDAIEQESRNLGSAFTPKVFAETFQKIIFHLKR